MKKESDQLNLLGIFSLYPLAKIPPTRNAKLVSFVPIRTFSCKQHFIMDNHQLQEMVEAAWDDKGKLSENDTVKAVEEVVDKLDAGELRVAEPTDSGWQVNEWVKKGVVLYFPTRNMEKIESYPFEYHDKVPLKKDFDKLGVRVVPDAIARYGAFVAPDVVMMPSYVNIGSFIDRGTMVDTWATVGSCAQIGQRVHLSGGVGIGGVLEPVQASPVIIEDNCFIGSRSIVVEGVHVKKEAVLGANVVLTQSTKIIDVTGSEPVEHKGVIPERAVVIPGSYTKNFPAGQYQVACALIVGQRKESTNKKTSLNEALRQYSVSA